MMDAIDQRDIERLEKLYAESTQGLWMCVETAQFFGGTPVEVYFHAPLNGMELSDEEFAKHHTAGPICTHVRSKADGEFIAAMHRMAPRIISALKGQPALPRNDPLLSSSVVSLGLSARAVKALHVGQEGSEWRWNRPIRLVSELIEQTSGDLLDRRNLGCTTLREIRERLAAAGLALNGESPQKSA